MVQKYLCGDTRRISGGKQIGNSSLESQGKHNKALIDQIGGELVETYEDTTSGYSKPMIKRKAIQNLLQDIKSGKINTVVFYEESRLTRDIISSYDVFDEIKEINPNVVYYSSQRMEEWDPYSSEALNELINAHNESRKKSLNARNNQELRLREKKRPHNNWPIGIEGVYTDETGIEVLIVNEDIVIVLFIFHLVSWGNSTRQVAKQLNDMGLNSKRISKWTHTTIYEILNNRIYIGYFIWNKRSNKHKSETIVTEQITLFEERPWEQVIPVDLWNIAHDELERKGKNKSAEKAKTSFLLASLVCCHECETLLKTKNSLKKGGKAKTRSGQPLKYYYCGECDYRIDSEQLDQLVTERFTEELSQYINEELVKRCVKKWNKSMKRLLDNLKEKSERLFIKEGLIEMNRKEKQYTSLEYDFLIKKVELKQYDLKSRRENVINMKNKLEVMLQSNSYNIILDRIKEIDHTLSAIERRYMLFSSVERISIKPLFEKKDQFEVRNIVYKNFPLPYFSQTIEKFLDEASEA